MAEERAGKNVAAGTDNGGRQVATNERPAPSQISAANSEDENGADHERQIEEVGRGRGDDHANDHRDAGAEAMREGAAPIEASSRKGNLTKIGKKSSSVTGRKREGRPVTESPQPAGIKPVLRIVKNDSSRDGNTQSVTGRKQENRQTKSDRTPPRREMDRFKNLLPELSDGSRWTVENEGFAWKVRRVWDVAGSTKSVRYFRVRWATWKVMRERYDDTGIAGILAQKVGAKEREIERDADARLA